MGCKGIVDYRDWLPSYVSNRFRWVFCQLEVLRHCFPSNLRHALMELPKSLDETYKRVLKDINKANREHAYRLLQCLVEACRPLRVEELADVLAFDLAKRVPKLISDWRWEDPEEAVLSACSSLVSVINDKGFRVVQLSHFSVKEFLKSNRLASSTEAESRFHIYIERSHTILAQACLGVLLCLDERTDTGSAVKIPLFRYAAEYWHQHARIGNVELRIADAMDCFFDSDKPHFSAWVRLQGRNNLGISTIWSSDMSDSVFPLCVAAGNGFRGLVERLIVKHPHQVNHLDGTFGTPLHASVLGGHVNVAQLLFEHGANINTQTSHCETPLHIAVLDGKLDAVWLLLEYGADVHVCDNNGDTPLHLAVHCGHFEPEVARELLEFNAAVDSRNDLNGCTPLHYASQKGNLNAVWLLLEYGADVRVCDKSGKTPLHLAVHHGHLEVVRELLELNAEVNSRDGNVFTPLHSASQNGNLDVAKLLLGHGAGVQVCDESGRTPLHLAAHRGHLEVARELLELHADVNSRDETGSTPLLMASANANCGVLQLLLDHNANVHVHDHNGNTPLHHAALSCRLEIARILLKHDVEINSRNAEGSTPLHMAAGSESRLKERKDFVQLLLDHGADVQARNLCGQTASDRASDAGTWSVRRTVARGVDSDREKEIVRLLSHHATK